MTQHFTTDRPRNARHQQRSLLLGAQPDVPGAQRKYGARILEKDVQKACLAMLQRHPRVALVDRINSRVVDVVDKKSKTGTRPMRTAPKGHADLKGMLVGGRYFECECKSSNGELTDEQAERLARINRAGGLGFVARCVDDVLKYIPMKETTT